jgi:hypothetical protein
VSDLCPRCSARGETITAVTVRTLGDSPRTVLVTRLCTADGCHHKYVVFKPEDQLVEEERKAWHDP